MGKVKDDAPAPKADKAGKADAGEKKKKKYTAPDDGCKRIKFNATTTDGAILAFARMGYNCKDPTYWVTILLHIFGQTLQLVIIWFFFATSVESMEDPFEDLQYNPVKAILEASVFWQQPLNRTFYPGEPGTEMRLMTQLEHGATKMCAENKAPKSLYIMFVVLLLGNGLQDIGNTLWRFMAVMKTPSGGVGDQPSKQALCFDPAPERGQNDVEHIKMPSKILICIMVLLPHLVCHLFVIWTGAKIVSLSFGVAAVIQNFLKIWFVAKLDYLFFAAFAPTEFRQYLSGAQYVVDNPTEGWWQTCFSTVFKLTLACSAAVWLYMHLFVRVRELTDVCQSYRTLFPEQFPKTCYGNGCGLNWARWMTS